MDADDPRRLDMAALVEAIWGRKALEGPEPIDPDHRELQNQALALAIKMYLQTYLDELAASAISRVRTGPELVAAAGKTP